MKILFVHNDYIRPSGEEAASGELARLMEEHGHEVRWFRKTSSDIHGLRGKVKAFFLGIHNPIAAKELADILDRFKPDIVQVQNLYPFISTSIFKPLTQRSIPVVMRCPNYRLFCPNGECLDVNGLVCERCFGRGKEFWCVYKNCLRSHLKSLGYALRGAQARESRTILEGVDTFIVQSDFQKRKFKNQGINAGKIAIIPGIAPEVETPRIWQAGKYVSYVGRVSFEKGIYEFIEAARMLPYVPFKVAGALDVSFKMPKNIPNNLEFVGFLKGQDLNDFYCKSRIIVVPSKWYEGFPNVIVRGMLLERPIITTNIGAMQSIIINGINGVLVPPADSDHLRSAIEMLYNNIALCKQLSEKAKQDASENYSRQVIYDKLFNVYKNLTMNKIYGSTPLSNLLHLNLCNQADVCLHHCKVEQLKVA